MVHYTDDGYSGGSFDRLDWKRMMSDIEEGKVGTVIAKDMSRIGRNYLEVGYYTEVVFRQRDIHFIAIANGVDSDNQGSSEFAPFLNVMNEWYEEDFYDTKVEIAKLLGEEAPKPPDLEKHSADQKVKRQAVPKPSWMRSKPQNKDDREGR
ncbi:MAG: recombinase family protein [Eubacteriales bacterium]